MVNKKLKILHVLPYFYPAWAYGGVPRVVFELTKELARIGHEVTVYTTDVFDRSSRLRGIDSGTEAVVDGVKVVYFKNLSNRLAYDLQLFLPFGLRKKIKETLPDFDIIHLHSHRHFLNNIVHYYAKKFKKPYLLSAHGTVTQIERRFFLKTVFDILFGRQILEEATHFVAVSKIEVDQYKSMGIPKERTTLIYNGIDIKALSKASINSNFKKKYNLEGKKIVLYLGRISPGKGVDFLLRAFSLLEDKESVLVIAGNDMGFKKELLKIIEKKNLNGRVIFTGLVTDEKKISLYRDANVVVYPAHNEIFGLVPFEALICETPVIVTDDSGCGDIIGGNALGATVKYGDVEGLRDKIRETLESENNSQSVQRGVEFIKKNLDWKIIGAKYTDLYGKIIS